MRFFTIAIVSLLMIGLSACNKKSDELWMAEREQIRIFLQQEGISDYTEDNSSGYFYYITQNGDSSLDKASIRSVVELKFESRLLNGNLVDDRYANSSLMLDLDNAISGLQLALPLFYIGTKARVILPSRLGYGVAGMSPNIPANSILVFDIEIIEIHPHF